MRAINMFYLGLIVISCAGLGFAIKARTVGWAPWKCLLIAGSGLAAAFALWLISPSAAAREQTLRNALMRSNEPATSVSIEPYYPEYSQLHTVNLVSRRLTVTDASTIERLRRSLSVAKIMTPNHPGVKWACRIRIDYESGAVGIVNAMHTHGRENGTMLDVIYGITMGETYRSDAVGTLLEQIAADATKNRDPRQR